MLIYGSKPVHLKSSQPTGIVCPSCRQTGSITLSAYSKHAHIFWIPLFPIGRLGVSQCQHCKQVLDDSQMPADIKREYNDLKATTRVPVWQFAGLALIGLLIIYGVKSSSDHAKDKQAYVAAPAAGDVYSYKTESGNYSTMRVASVSADSVFVSPNEYETDKVTAVYKIDKDENYVEYSYGISISEIKRMHDAGEIYDINRD